MASVVCLSVCVCGHGVGDLSVCLVMPLVVGWSVCVVMVWAICVVMVWVICACLSLCVVMVWVICLYLCGHGVGGLSLSVWSWCG